MDNVVLISIPKQDVNNPAAALGILSSICVQNNYLPVILDLNQELNKILNKHDWDTLEKKLILGGNDGPLEIRLENKIKKIFKSKVKKTINEHTKFIAISVFTFESIALNNILLDALKYINIPIVVGGSGLETIIDGVKYYKTIEDKVDYIVIGDGEISFDKILSNSAPTKVLKFSNDENLDSYPTPTYVHFPKENYSWNKVYITGSRGCVRKCTFCDVANFWPKFRYRDADLLIEEIRRHVTETGVTHFEFTDSLINGSVSNFYKFNLKLAELKASDVAFSNITYGGQFICRPKNQMPPEHYEAMYYAGCSKVTVGIESFSSSVRNHMRKKFSNEDIDYHFEQCARWNIPNVLLMIIGYPTETELDHQENIKALYKYQKYVYSNTIFMISLGFTMHLIHGTPIMNILEDLEIEDYSAANIFKWNIGDNTLKNRILRRLEIHETAVKLGYKIPRSYSNLKVLEDLSLQVN